MGDTLKRPDGRRASLVSHLGRLAQAARWLGALGSLTALALCAVTLVWAAAKGVSFVVTAVSGRNDGTEAALVYLFESIDTILIGVMLLQVGLGLWELCVGDLTLPPSLTTDTFEGLEGRVASTLVLVLAVRFLEELVRTPQPERLMAVGITIGIVGGLLVVYQKWK